MNWIGPSSEPVRTTWTYYGQPGSNASRISSEKRASIHQIRGLQGILESQVPCRLSRTNPAAEAGWLPISRPRDRLCGSRGKAAVPQLMRPFKRVIYIETDPARKSDLSNHMFISTGLPDRAISLADARASGTWLSCFTRRPAAPNPSATAW